MQNQLNFGLNNKKKLGCSNMTTPTKVCFLIISLKYFCCKVDSLLIPRHNFLKVEFEPLFELKKKN